MTAPEEDIALLESQLSLIMETLAGARRVREELGIKPDVLGLLSYIGTIVNGLLAVLVDSGLMTTTELVAAMVEDAAKTSSETKALHDEAMAMAKLAAERPA